MSTTEGNPITFATPCKNGCGTLTLPLHGREHIEDRSNEKWVRCTECESINLAKQVME